MQNYDDHDDDGDDDHDGDDDDGDDDDDDDDDDDLNMPLVLRSTRRRTILVSVDLYSCTNQLLLSTESWHCWLLTAPNPNINWYAFDTYFQTFVALKVKTHIDIYARVGEDCGVRGVSWDVSVELLTIPVPVMRISFKYEPSFFHLKFYSEEIPDSHHLTL